MSAITDTDADLAAIRSGLSNLKGDVASPIEHFKGGAKNGIQDVTDQIADGVRFASESARRERRANRQGDWSLDRTAAGSRAWHRAGSWLRRRSCVLAASESSVAFQFHQTRARRSSVEDLSTDTSHGVDPQLRIIEPAAE
jgi:hypothetical protein